MNKNKIAIVGAAFRLPGNVDNLEQFWQLLLEGQNLVTQIENDRWDTTKYSHPRKSEKGKSFTFASGVLQDLDKFDAKLFGISPREARQMDPRQRILLELTWHALEDGLQVPSKLRGSDCGVYIGISGNEYSMVYAQDPSIIDPYTMTGNACSIASNRISYSFDFRGPSMSIDTACSSALVSLHQACLAIQNNEVSSAIAGCAGINLHPLAYVGFSKAKMLSTDGNCKAFDQDANGYVRSEGAIVLYIKALDAALADGDPVHAVIVSTGVNSDGKSSSLPVPSMDAQFNLLEETSRKADIAPTQIDYMEAHGTGTPVGDPIEAEAISKAYAKYREQDNPLLIGSVKTNLGHMEVSSGMAGLVKVMASLKHRALPPSIHYNNSNPNIDFDALNLKVVNQTIDLSSHKHSLHMGINCFGFGGTNSHVILTESPKENKKVKTLKKLKNIPPLFLSGKTEVAAKQLAANYLSALHEGGDYYAHAYGALNYREKFDYVDIFYGDNVDALQRQLSIFSKGKNEIDGYIKAAKLGEELKTVFVFSGNGSQWFEMGQALLKEDKIFKKDVEQIAKILCELSEADLLDIIQNSSNENIYQETANAQIGLFALQVTIANYLIRQGMLPSAVIGHSVGEVAAAYVCGALTLEQAVKVVYFRSLHQSKTKGSGTMAAISLGLSDTQELLSVLALQGKLDIAGINSSKAVTLSGDNASIEKVVAYCSSQNIFAQKLDLDYPFHSQLVCHLKADFLADLGDVCPSNSTTIQFISAVEGNVVASNFLTADYWWRNIAEPVSFFDGIKAAIALGHKVFIEIGSHPVLQTYVNDILRFQKVRGAVIPTLRRHQDSLSMLDKAFMLAWGTGAKVNKALWFPEKPSQVELPKYPMQRESFWLIQSGESHDPIAKKTEHPLLGWRVFIDEPSWENHLDALVQPYLRDHQVDRAIVMPATAYVEMATAAFDLHFGDEKQSIIGLDILAPMVFDEDSTRLVRTELLVDERAFVVKSKSRLTEENWVLHARGGFQRYSDLSEQRLSLARIRKRVKTKLSKQQHYELARRIGLKYGEAFQGLTELHLASESVLSEIEIPVSLRDHYKNYQLHPALLDICLQSIIGLFKEQIDSNQGGGFLPVRVERVKHISSLATFKYIYAQVNKFSKRSILADFRLLDSKGEVLAILEGCRFRQVRLRQNQSSSAFYQYQAELSASIHDVPFMDIDKLAQISKTVKNEIGHPNKSYFEVVSPLIDSLVCRYVIDALKPLLIDFSGNFIALCEKCKIAESQQALFQRCINILEEDGHLVLDEQANYQWQQLDHDLPEADMIWLAIIGDHPCYISELTLLGRSGKNLLAILKGEFDPAELLTSNEKSGVREHLKISAPSISYKYQICQSLLKALIDKKPLNKKLNILEYGVSEGGFSQQILSALSLGDVSYCIADESELALAKAKAAIGHLSQIQSFHFSWDTAFDRQHPLVEEKFDIIIFPNGIHDIDNIDLALAQIKNLLNIDGVLILPEMISERRHDLTVGLNSEWWVHYKSGKAMSRLRTKEFWQKKLRDAGYIFDEPIYEYDVNSQEGGYTFACQSLSKESPATSLSKDQLFFIYDDAEQFELIREHLSSDARKIQGIKINFELSAEQHIESLLNLVTHTATSQLIYLIKPFEFGLEQSRAEYIFKLFQSHLILSTNDILAALPVKIFLHNAMPSNQVVSDNICSPEANMLWNFARVFMNETPNLDIKLIDLQLARDASLVSVINKEFSLNDLEDEILYNQNARYVLRLLSLDLKGESVEDLFGVKLDFEEAGPLKNLKWYPNTEFELARDEILVAPKATGLNFRDVMYAMRLISDEAVENGFLGANLGMEFAGEIIAVGDHVKQLVVGDKVMGFAPGSLSTQTKTKAGAVSRLPLGWTFADAATIPTAFFTAYYALEHLARAEAGETILIHGAAGGVGIAAIQLAHFLELNIIATAGTQEKRDFLGMMGVDHVFDSRKNTYADQILEVTQGKGVDIVLNSLAGEAIDLNLSVLKPFGRFLELGKRDFFENSKIGLRPFRNNISYYGIDADQLMIERPELTEKLFKKVISLFEEDILRPLPYRTFGADRVADAFRYMQQSKQIGKIVISFEQKTIDKQRTVELSKDIRTSDHKSYLITGGTSGFGLETAKWLSNQGAKHLVLLSRSGTIPSDNKELLEQISANGGKVEVKAVDVCDKAALQQVISQLPYELDGVFHCAAVFDDVYIKDMSDKQLKDVLSPKVLGAKYLHELTQDSDLSYFVLYSSATTLFGNPGQANYVAANAYLEGLAIRRHQLGLVGTYIAWGAIDDVGYLSRNDSVKNMMKHSLGIQMSSASAVLDKLGIILNSKEAGVALMEVNLAGMMKILPKATTPKFSQLDFDDLAADDKNSAEDVRAMLHGKTLNEAEELISEILQEEVAQILCLPKENILVNQSISDLGVDSLMGVELVRAVEQRFAVSIPMMSLSQGPSVRKIARKIALQLISNEKTSESSGTELEERIKAKAQQHAQDLSEDQLKALTKTIEQKQSEVKQRDDMASM